ncbi:IclR family transcriptional regulator [Planotetraspora sp. A-T 1434]|uniref:IclR family transcriptional regulator n=1 Tax=Planotetraspora sp. A-T 1434 TaxID=2979219 RepID=UPI0021BEED7B|nr:IclR family transcriptional regulator [Planotetraspora sp. A-T 1434]MCT9930324.1 IclR family transcriptional regulator [Planotetraspora sp. A-T 1434]
MDTENLRRGTQAVDRAIAVLRAFERTPTLTPTEVAHRLGLSVSTAHRIIRALHSAGMLGQDQVTERYHLGITTATLGRLALERLGATMMLPELEKLRDRTGEAVNLGVRIGDEVAVLLQVPSRHPLRYEQEPGSRNPIHVCAMGKALLAFGDPVVTMEEPFTRYTGTTITTRAEMAAELDRIRSRGAAVNFEERVVGVRAVAVPLRDGRGAVLAAIAIQGPAVRLGDDRLPELTDELTKTASSLAAAQRGLPTPSA